MQIQKAKTSDIKLNPNNPRIIKDDKFKKLVQSVKDFPQMLDIRPIVVNDEMIVLGGNMRLKACIEAGIKEVSIIKASELTLEQQNEFIIKDNVGFGEWNWDDLANDWDEELLVEWGLDLPVNFETNEPDDISENMKTNFRIEVILTDEKSQELLYNELIERSYECRLLTL
jgi:ParB-like chromosome segregation protein Spo0J